MVDPSLGSRASSGGGDAHRSTLMLDQAGANRTSQPVSEIAERLGAVQRQQADTVGQLLQLRQEQLRLRRQQLAALACLLRTEAELLAVNALTQGGPVAQALVLLEDCLDNVQLAGAALQSAHAAGAAAGGDICSISQTVADADARAEEVSALARQLLLLMRSQIVLASGTGDDSGRLVSRYHEHLPGLMPSELDSMPTLLCPPDHALLETPDKCSICLSLFQAQDRLRLLPCAHFHHQACVDEWLLTRATCPLCNQSARPQPQALSSRDQVWP
ncbi:hypothetical protein WJX84_009073 [Apatococcus fuscideae]|uniref:RING-type domain-containing protein n=1 Tax=Apatococcus fuscideae TaxID=2026836 RepID=A0AAW1S7J0_9CHLO